MVQELIKYKMNDCNVLAESYDLLSLYLYLALSLSSVMRTQHLLIKACI